MAYNIQLTNITAGSDNLINTIALKVLDGTNPITTLVQGNFEITSNIALTTAPTVTGGDGGNYTLTFSTKPNITTDYVVIKVTDNANIVKLFVDPSEIFDSSGQANFNKFAIKDPGQYTFVLDQVNEQPEINVPSPVYNFVKPATTDSSIAIANRNPNQAIVITNPTTGAPVSLLVTLKYGANPTDFITGPNSVSIYSNPLFDMQ